MTAERNRPVVYSLVGGVLPPGLSLNTATGGVRGMINPADFLDAPVWNTASGSLGNWEEFDVVDPITLSASLQGDATSLVYTVMEGYRNNRGLPWGITLDPYTGVISGTLLELRDPTSATWTPEEEPQWVTAAGKLASYDELAEVTGLSVQATPYGSRVLRYSIERGAIPWGLEMATTTGAFSGTIRRLKVLGGVPIIEPKPRWLSPPSIGTVDELKTANFAILAQPRLGNKVTYYIRSGGLPWGLSLNAATGAITGTALRLRAHDGFTWNPAQSPVWETPSGSILSTEELSVIDMPTAFEATAYQTRTLRFEVTNGQLPWGLEVTPAGAITGSIAQLQRIDNQVHIIEPKPTWGTSAGNIGVFNELEAGVNVQLAATANRGTTIRYNIREGGLPWGLYLDPTTGTIAGSIAQIKPVDTIVVSDPPTFSTAPGTTIITSVAGGTPTFTIGVSVHPGRTLKAIEVVDQRKFLAGLPNGLLLNSATGEITGTVTANAVVGTYNVIFRAIDNTGAVSNLSAQIVIQGT
ncbi:putative Ig domain protein [compost metagenome]